MNVTQLSTFLLGNTAFLFEGSSANVSPSDIDDVTSSMTTVSTPQLDSELTLAEKLLLLTKEQRDKAEEILLIIRYVIFVIALPATIVNILVFMQPNMRGATSVYVIGLSMAQLVYIMTNVIGRIMAETIENPLNDYTYLVYSVYVSSYLSIAMRRASYLVMCYVAVERLYAVLRPLHIKQFLLTRYPLTFTALTFLLSALWHVYMLTQTSIRQVRSSRTGNMVHMFVYTDGYKENPEIADGFSTAAPILMTYIPLLAMMTLNILMVWALRRHNSQRALQSSANEEAKRQRERQLTRTILATTIIYVLLSLPYALHNLFKSIFVEFDKLQKYKNLYYVTRSACFTLTLLSCALDFCCFVLLSSNFRSALMALSPWRAARGGKRSTAQVSKSMTTSTEVESKY